MKHLLSIDSLSNDQFFHLIDLAAELKKSRKSGKEKQCLKGRNIVLIFEKESTRTRCAFETAAFQQGAGVTYLGGNDSHIGKKESIKDTARVLGRMYDGIGYRGYSQGIVQTLADYSGVPVWNALTDSSHPTQILADLLTIKEHTKRPFSDVKVCFLGDAKNNVAMSLMVGCAKAGIRFSAAAPSEYHPDPRTLLFITEKYGADLLYSEDVEEAVKDADFLYTDLWVSMGEPQDVWEKRIKDLSPYQVNDKVVELTGNPNCKFMHCLPALHDLNTNLAQEISSKFSIREMEVTNSLFESNRSIVFDEAENRLHTIKACMVWSLSEKK